MITGGQARKSPCWHATVVVRDQPKARVGLRERRAPVWRSSWVAFRKAKEAAEEAGQAKGQALDLNGGLWYVLAPSGKVIRTTL